MNPLILGAIASGLLFPAPAIIQRPESPRIIKPEPPRIVPATFPFPVFSPVVASAGIQYVGGQLAGTLGTTSTWSVTFNLSGGLASTPAAGDYVMICYGVGSVSSRNPALSITSPTDYTVIGAEQFISNTFATNGEVYAKFMGGTPDTSVTFSGTGSNFDAGLAYISVWRGVNTTTPIDVTEVIASGTGTFLANPGAITPVTAGAYIVAIGICQPGAAVGAFSSSDLTNFLSTLQTDTNGCVVGGGYKAWTSGAFDPAEFTKSGTPGSGHSWCAFTFALRPA